MSGGAGKEAICLNVPNASDRLDLNAVVVMDHIAAVYVAKAISLPSTTTKSMSIKRKGISHE
jgi:hypothetical protein